MTEMQRWDFGPNDSMMTPQETGRFYVASDVDACFGDLARALSRCSQQMGALSKETARYSEASATAMVELGEALMNAICKKNPHTGERELIENSAAETAQCFRPSPAPVSDEVNVIDQLRWERDTARAERDRLKEEAENLRTLLKYANEALEAERRSADQVSTVQK